MLIIGHRGASGYEPENTLLSFRRAMELNADMIEMDVQKCRSGEPVILHDEALDRTTDGKGSIKDYSLLELRTFNAGKGERIPSLDEVLDLLNGNIKLNLELKGEGTAEPVFVMLKKYINKGIWRYNDFYISSFKYNLLKEFISVMPRDSGIKICPLISETPVNFSGLAAELNPYSINISLELLNPGIISEAHEKNMKVFVYTVNDVSGALKLKSLGADGIFTDYPDMFRKI